MIGLESQNMNESFTKVNIAYLTIGIILGFVVGLLLFSDKAEAPVSVVQEQITSTSTTPTLPGDLNYSLQAHNQGAGNQVVVSSVSLPSRSWVAVREDKAGKMGNILGAQRLNAGVYENVIIDLLRSMEPGHTYHVVLYSDDGDGTFDFRVDSIISLSGVVVESAFDAL